MIPLEIQENLPHFQNFVVEESRKEAEPRSTGRSKGGSKDQGWGLEEERGVQIQFQAEASVVSGRRPGDAKGPPIPAREQVIPQVDWSFQSDRGPWEWSIQAQDIKRWGDSSY